MNDLMQKIEDLRAQLASLEKEEVLLSARDTIENLMSRYQYLVSAMETDSIVDECFAAHTPNTTAEFASSGVYVGVESIKRVYQGWKKIPGCLYVCTTTTPIIEVAGDGQTAKGVWVCLGNESDARGKYVRDPATGDYVVANPEIKVMADWILQRYGVDFILEDGKWKIWHLHLYDVFRTPFDEDWVSYSVHRDQELNESNLTFPPADLPSTYQWRYTPDAVVELVPAYPEPYETFDDTFAY